MISPVSRCHCSTPLAGDEINAERIAKGLPPVGAIETAAPKKSKNEGATLGKRVERFAPPQPLR